MHELISWRAQATVPGSFYLHLQSCIDEQKLLARANVCADSSPMPCMSLLLSADRADCQTSCQQSSAASSVTVSLRSAEVTAPRSRSVFAPRTTLDPLPILQIARLAACLTPLKPSGKLSVRLWRDQYLLIKAWHSVQELASISAQTAFIFSLFSLASSRFFTVRSTRSARRHLLTSRLMLLHMPIDFQSSPRAWHSSNALMTSSQPVASQKALKGGGTR